MNHREESDRSWGEGPPALGPAWFNLFSLQHQSLTANCLLQATAILKTGEGRGKLIAFPESDSRFLRSL